MSLLYCAGPAAALAMLPPPPARSRLSAADVRVLQARAAIGRSDLDVALRLFEDAVALDATLGIAHMGRVACLVALGRDEEAAAAMDDANAAPPAEGVTAHLARGFAKRGESRVAMQLVGALLQHAPEAAPALADDERLAPLRDDPRFQQMVGRL